MVLSLTKAKTPAWTEELLRQSLLSEELIDVHFHLFASRSKSSGSAVNVRTLHANTVLLKKSAKYFADCKCTCLVTSSMTLIRTSQY